MTEEFLGERLIEANKRLAYHVTRAASLPDIAASGALLCANARRERATRHGWGAGENSRAGARLVCLSLAPGWLIMNSQFPGEEAAILGFEISAVADLPGVRPCPLNSAASEAAAYVTGRVSPQLALSEVLEPANWSRAELLVPDHVPLGALRVVVLSDREADKRWHVLLKSELGPALASRVQIRAWTVGDARRPRFPDDHRVTEPRALVRRGTDQRVSATTYLDPADVLEVTDDELHEDLAWLDAPDDHDEDPDLYAELYGDDPGAASERLSARLNDLPESSDDERDDDSGDPWC